MLLFALPIQEWEKRVKVALDAAISITKHKAIKLQNQQVQTKWKRGRGQELCYRSRQMVRGEELKKYIHKEEDSLLLWIYLVAVSLL